MGQMVTTVYYIGVWDSCYVLYVASGQSIVKMGSWRLLHRNSLSHWPPLIMEFFYQESHRTGASIAVFAWSGTMRILCIREALFTDGRHVLCQPSGHTKACISIHWALPTNLVKPWFEKFLSHAYQCIKDKNDYSKYNKTTLQKFHSVLVLEKSCLV